MGDDALLFLLLVLSYVGTVWCWRRIARSRDPRFFKIAFAMIAAIPLFGPFLYLFVDMPPRVRHTPVYGKRRKPSALLRRWNEREHVYLAWTSVVFWSLAAVAYWMNDWVPGDIHASAFSLGHYTDVDVIFYALLVGAVLTFGAAVRVKVLLARELKEMSDAGAREPGAVR